MWQPDLAALKADIQEQIAAADPGGRPDAEIRRYASDAYLNDIIRWVLAREADKHAERQAEAEQPVAPSFPDRGVPRLLPRNVRRQRR